jgi:hypothetical protein
MLVNFILACCVAVVATFAFAALLYFMTPRMRPGRRLADPGATMILYVVVLVVSFVVLTLADRIEARHHVGSHSL